MSAGLGARASELRSAFDLAFAQPPAATGDTTLEDLLAIRIGTAPYAIRLSEIAGVFADKKITALPGPIAELLGVAGFRGAIVPVYDLRALLGVHTSATARWLVLAAGAPVGLAFDGFDGHLRIERERLRPEGRIEASEPYVRQVVQTPGDVRPVIDLASVLNAIKKRAPHAPFRKEPSR